MLHQIINQVTDMSCRRDIFVLLLRRQARGDRCCDIEDLIILRVIHGQDDEHDGEQDNVQSDDGTGDGIVNEPQDLSDALHVSGRRVQVSCQEGCNDHND